MRRSPGSWSLCRAVSRCSRRTSAGRDHRVGLVAGRSVELDQREVAASPGEKVTFESTVRNTGDRPLADYVAHLNILSTDKSVYVDPEDWSPKRTQFLDEIPPGRVHDPELGRPAVTSGPLLLFVVRHEPDGRHGASSGPLNMTVGGQRVVNAGGVLPLVLWMPAGVLALLGATSVRRRRHR